MIKQCTGFYVCPIAPTTKVSLNDNYRVRSAI